MKLEHHHRSSPPAPAAVRELIRSASAQKMKVSTVLHLMLVFAAALACSGCGGSLARHREKLWVQPAIAGGGWSAGDIESVTRAVDGTAVRYGLKKVPGIPPRHLLVVGKRITCSEHLSYLGSSYILSAFHTQKDSRGPIIVDMDHDPGCPMIWETKSRRMECTALWSGVSASLRDCFGKRVTEQPNPQGGASGRQPFGSEVDRTSAAAASRRLP